MALLAAAAMGSATPVAAQDEPPAVGDLAFVLTRALYPVQFLAVCWRDVESDRFLTDVGLRWNERNGGLLANLEAMGADMDSLQGMRAEADEATLVEIRSAIAAQADEAAYCDAIARLIDAGNFDIDQRDDLEAPLKRIFRREQ